ncbi:MAG: hypothetical protein ABL999_15415 [Pyrinomonadaceae bacterium]
MSLFYFIRLADGRYRYPGIPGATGGDGADIGAVEMRPTAEVSGRVTTPTGLACETQPSF